MLFTLFQINMQALLRQLKSIFKVQLGSDAKCISCEIGFCALRHRKAVADQAKLVLQAPDMAEARSRLNEFIEEFESKVPKPVNCLEEAFEDARAVMVLPDTYRKRLRTTNMQERLNEEIRRRQRVIRIFPNDDSALR